MKLRTRAELGPEQWDAFVEAHPLGWFWHTSHWIDYSCAYTPAAKDLSFVVLNGNDISALVPLLLDESRLVMGGQVTPAPIFSGLSQELAAVTHKHACELIGGEPLPIQMRPGVRPLESQHPSCRAYEHATYVVDLRPDEKLLWQNIRKSYKSLIHKTERDYEIVVEAKPEAVACSEHLHIAVAGRKTRSTDTWRLMGDWTTLGHAIIARAFTKTSDMSPVAFAYVIRYKEWAYYASGASLEPNISHALQWHLMRTLKAGGTRYYEIGHGAEAESSEKDKGIAHFKAGFGAQKIPLVVVTPAGVEVL